MKKNDLTIPIYNILFQFQDYNFIHKFNIEYLSIRPSDVSSIEHHKNKLGKQKYCITLPFKRCWIWEGENWRVYVSKKGAQFEVLENSTLEQAKIAWQDYYEKVK